MYVVDGEIKEIFAEAGFQDNCPTDPFEVSDADTMLKYLREHK
jgi:peroxiredoxin